VPSAVQPGLDHQGPLILADGDLSFAHFQVKCGASKDYLKMPSPSMVQDSSAEKVFPQLLPLDRPESGPAYAYIFRTIPISNETLSDCKVIYPEPSPQADPTTAPSLPPQAAKPSRKHSPCLSILGWDMPCLLEGERLKIKQLIQFFHERAQFETDNDTVSRVFYGPGDSNPPEEVQFRLGGSVEMSSYDAYTNIPKSTEETQE
jgi:hypothetical protein